MANKLADELLHMILSHVLHIPDSQFISPSLKVFGRNDKVSSSGFLLVSKKWLKIATPLLYEVAILRSTAQAQALDDVFAQHQDFARYVKKIRLENAYSCLWSVFRQCSSLHTICLTLDLYANVSVTGLCRSLSAINPTRVILHDSFETSNVKVNQVFKKLLDSIPQWTNLREFDFPYGHPPRPRHRFKRDQLADALAKSDTLRALSISSPEDWDEVWCKLARNRHITFHLNTQTTLKFTNQSKFLKSSTRDPGLPNRIKITRRKVTRNTPQSKTTTATLKNLTFKPLATADPSTETAIWTRIISFAMSFGHPDSFDISQMQRWSLGSLNSTRKSLTLVSKYFHAIAQPFLFHTPLFVKERSLTRFMLLSAQNVNILHQMRVLYLSSLTGRRHESSDVDFELKEIIPHLTGLKHFVGSPVHAVSSDILELLAKTAGNTLVSIRDLNIARKDIIPLSVFDRFKRLEHITFQALPHIPAINPFLVATLSPNYSKCPLLTSAAMPLEPFSLAVLQVCGARLLKLEISQYKLGTESQYPDFLSLCPNLQSLEWKGDWESLGNVLLRSSGHAFLKTVEIRWSSWISRKWWATRVDSLLGRLKLAKFVGLREIHISNYSWPIGEREIAKDLVIQEAIKIKEEYGVDITDSSGKAWRIRAKKRR